MAEVVVDLNEYKKRILERLDEFKELKDTEGGKKAKKTIEFSINTVFSNLNAMGSINKDYMYIMYIQLKHDIYSTLIQTSLKEEQVNTLTNSIMYSIANLMTISEGGKGIKLVEKTTNVHVSETEMNAFR